MWKAYTAVGRSYDLSTAVGRLASRAVGWDFHFDCWLMGVWVCASCKTKKTLGRDVGWSLSESQFCFHAHPPCYGFY